MYWLVIAQDCSEERTELHRNPYYIGLETATFVQDLAAKYYLLPKTMYHVTRGGSINI